KGRIVKTHPGKDNYVCVVDVKTASGMFIPPVTRLATVSREVSPKRPCSSIEATTAEKIPSQKIKDSFPILPTLLTRLLITITITNGTTNKCDTFHRQTRKNLKKKKTVWSLKNGNF
ncbi:hypothetical protein KR038_008129, partial [Drosophila bunnanda]